MEITRRAFLTSSAASGALASAGVLSSSPSTADTEVDFKVDSICYFVYTRDWNPDAVLDAARKAAGGGITAIVLDAIYPREYPGALDRFAAWGDLFSRPDSIVVPILKAEDFRQAKSSQKLGVVLACQDASILGSPLRFAAILQMFHRLGLRVLQFTHNARTQWGDSCLEKSDGGLSLAGESLVAAMNKLGVLIDLSHCSRETLLEAVALSSKPCAVTHAGCRALAPTARNKSDDEIRALAAKGGFFGVFNQLNWLTNKPRGTIEDVLNHVDHAVQIIGPSQVGFGSDGYISEIDAPKELKEMQEYQQRGAGRPTLEWPWDVIRAPELNSPRRIEVLGESLARRGYKDADIRGILGNNFVRVFERVCG